MRGGPLTRFLERAPGAVFVLFAVTVSFTTYFCMYAFRKPFAAAHYEGVELGGWPIKEVFVISQIIGYALSKLIGIKFCSEVTRERRAAALVFFILAAEGALVLFAIVPPAWKVAAIFLNGLPLGMIWGLVVWYLEGRRTSELLLAGLSCSFIISSGIVKDVGRELTSRGVSEWWMPAATGAIFLPLYLLSVWLLNQIPQPDEEDVEARVERETMDGRHRVAFIRHFLPGLVLLLIAYFFLTAYRDYRDNFGVEIFAALGYETEPALFTKAELVVAFGVMGALALLNLIRDNRLGLIGAYAIMTAGTLLLAGATLLLDAGVISGFWWMTLVGLGSYLTYVPYGSVLFDRLIASTRVVATAVFAIYVADFIGYAGSISALVFKESASGGTTRYEFFRSFTYLMAAVGAVTLVASCIYFLTRHRAPTGAGGRLEEAAGDKSVKPL